MKVKEKINDLFDDREGYGSICEKHGYINREVCPMCQAATPLFDDVDSFFPEDNDKPIDCIECWKRDGWGEQK